MVKPTLAELSQNNRYNRYTLVMAASLSDQGVPVEVHVFEHGPHAMATADQVSASDREHMDPDAAKWLSLADAWLKKRLALPVE